MLLSVVLRLVSIIDLYGADYTTIDGSNNGTGSRNLTITNTNTSANVAAIKVTSLGLGLGATRNTIKNLNLSGGATNVVNFGIFVGGTTIISSGADNDYLTIQNNAITNIGGTAMYIYGTTKVTAGANDSLLVKDNTVTINSTTTPMGIQVGNGLGGIISGNTVDIITTAGTQPSAISIETGFINCLVDRNKVTRSSTTSASGYGGRGITIGTSDTASNVTVSNNVVFGMSGSNWSTFGNSSSLGIGIGVVGNSTTLTNATGGVNLYHNSVNIYGVPTLATGNKLTAALWIGSAAKYLDIRNNVFKNTMNDTANAATYSFAVFCEATSNTIFTNMNYNDYYVDSTKRGYLSSFGVGAYNVANIKTTLAALQATFGQNANSMFVDPQFNSNTVLLPNVGAPILAAGTPIAAVTVDYAGNARNGSTPSMGAYENGGDGAAPIITFTALANRTVLASSTISATIQDLGSSAVGTDSTVNMPRIYFKKSTDANTFGVANDSTGNGWKYVTTASVGSPYALTLDYSLLRSSLNGGDVVQYFIVAQDYAGNLDASPSSGFSGTNVGNLVNAPSSPRSYIIVGPPLAGNYTVGTSVASSYPTITAAATDVALRGVSAPVLFELVDTAYTDNTSETFPINFGRAEGASLTNTITFRPVATATSVRIGDSTNTATSTTVSQGIFNFDNASYYTWDGRAGGVGTTPILTIEQNNLSGYTIRLVNDASYNTFTYNNIEGCGTSTLYSTIYMPLVTASATNTRGCDSNTFSYNNIFNSKAIPNTHFYIYGTSDANTHDYNRIVNNNIYNFTGYGIYNYFYVINSNIQGNSMYQTATRTALTYFMYVYYPTFGRQDIKDNYIGGTAPLCGGTPMTYFGGTSAMNGIYIYQGANNGATNVTGNTFKNINFSTSSASTTAAFIYFVNGRGRIDNNTIGSQTDTSNIVYASSGVSATFQMIGTGTGTFDTVTVNNNNFGGITFNQVGGVGGTSLRCVDLGGGTTGYFQVNNNIVGGTVANSLMQRTANSILALSGRNTGVSNNYAIQMSNNIVRNATTALATSSIQGILNAGTVPSTMVNNTVYNLFSAGSSSIGINAGFAGNATTASVVSNNNIYGLKMTGTAGSTFTGLQLSGSTQTNVRATNNRIHSFYPSDSIGTVVNGILMSGNYTVANNFVRLGVDTAGSDVNISTAYRGINETSGASNIYYNTVYIGGSGTTTGTDSSFAIRSFVTSGTRDVRNNIFANYRLNSSGSGKHYAMSFANNTGLTLDNNNYYTVSSPLSYFNGADQANLSAWRTAMGKDANSMVEAPAFVAPNGSASGFDLHITPATTSLMESGGATIPSYAVDFDGDARPGPAGSVNGGGLGSDLGADEFDGSFFPINMGAQLLASPSGSCAISGKTVTIRIKNYAVTQTIDFSVNPVTVSASVSGTNPTTFSPITLTTGTLAAGATQDIVFTTSYDMSAIGTYTFDASTSVTGDANPSNDVMPSTNVVITALTAGTNTSNETSFCKLTGPPVISTTATGGDIQWMYSTVSNSGPWTNVGTNTTSFTPASSITTTTYFMATISCNSTTISAGDTVGIVVPVIVSTVPASRCGTGTVNLTVNSGIANDVNWYSTPTGGVPLYTGSTFTTPSISSTTNYYAAASFGGSSYTTGKPAYNTTDGTNTAGAYIIFDALTNFTLSTVDINPYAATNGTPGTVTISWANSAGVVQQSTTVSVIGYNTATVQTVALNFNITPGTNHRLVYTSSTGVTSMYRDFTAAATSFPYTVPGIVSITNSSLSGYYYYFYNWVIGSGCESARQMVTATVNPLATTPASLARVAKGTDSILVNWVGSASATGYRIDVATDAGFTAMLGGYTNLSVADTFKAINGLTSGTNYFIRVRAENATNCTSSNSTVLNDTTTTSGATLNLTAFLQGLYLGGGVMISSPFNADGVSSPTVADTITVELRNPDYSLAYSVSDTLSTTGQASITFPGSAVGNKYYVVIRHRNSIETWSSDSILIGSTTSYDFSSGVSQAFGDNMVDDGSGVFLIYGGDINQDGSVDFGDYPDLDLGSSNSDVGYFATDLNGDSSVDFGDYPMLDLNSSNSIFSFHP
jgi:trimeric autotransporter adhesin